MSDNGNNTAAGHLEQVGNHWSSRKGSSSPKVSLACLPSRRSSPANRRTLFDRKSPSQVDYVGPSHLASENPRFLFPMPGSHLFRRETQRGRSAKTTTRPACFRRCRVEDIGPDHPVGTECAWHNGCEGRSAVSALQYGTRLYLAAVVVAVPARSIHSTPNLNLPMLIPGQIRYSRHKSRELTSKQLLPVSYMKKL